MKMIYFAALSLFCTTAFAQGNGITKPSTGAPAERINSATTTEHIYFPTEKQEERMEEVEARPHKKVKEKTNTVIKREKKE